MLNIILVSRIMMVRGRVPKDLKEAVRYYRLAAAQRHASAQCAVGVCYKIGYGVPKDPKVAVRYSSVSS